MTLRRLIDTNVIVRHLVQDHPKHAAAAGRLFAACDAGEVKLVLLPAVLAEAAFVLESFYEHSRVDIARTLRQLISSPGLEVPHSAIHLDALERYAQSRIHFVDCVLAATAASEGIAIASFDADFRKFKDVQVALEFSD